MLLVGPGATVIGCHTDVIAVRCPFTAFGNAVLATVDVAVLTVVETVWSDLVAGCATRGR